ncbi:MAG: hypothetical protein WB992_08845 [Bryobacteraceae bacterium]
MQPADRATAVNGALCSFYFRFPPAVWGIEPRMTALSRMYELTGDRKYLDHMREFIELALTYRDDHYDPGTAPFPCGATSPPYPAKPIDDFRGHVMPGWGGSSPDIADFNFVPEVVTSLYGYSIARFARIVAEDPTLQATYGNDAIRYVNATLETAWAFMPQVDTRSVGNLFEANLSQLEIYRTKPSSSECQQAYDKEKAAMDAANAQAAAAGSPLPFDQSSYNRLAQQKTNCQNLSCVAGAPLGNNESGAYAMMLIELWRVLDSDFYRRSNQQASNAELSRSLFPLLVSRVYRFVVNRLQPVADARGDRYHWNYQDDQPSCVRVQAEDVRHGALDMRYLEVLRAAFDRLNAEASKAGEPIPLDLPQLRHFANTFLEEIAPGQNFNEDVDGRPDNPDSNGIWEDNANCDGWVNLAVADPNVYRICHDASLNIVSNSQPYLNIGNHSALLAAKPFSAGLVSASGKVTFLRVNEVGTGFGSPIEFLDAEAIVQLDTQPGKSFGFQLRTDKQEADHLGMLEVLRSAFHANRTVDIEYLRNGAQNGLIIRVARVNLSGGK